MYYIYSCVSIIYVISSLRKAWAYISLREACERCAHVWRHWIFRKIGCLECGSTGFHIEVPGFEIKTLGWCPKMWKVLSHSSNFSFWVQNVQQRVGHRFPSKCIFNISFFDVLVTLGFNFTTCFFKSPRTKRLIPHMDKWCHVFPNLEP